jgi:hypothetical protein
MTFYYLKYLTFICGFGIKRFIMDLSLKSGDEVTLPRKSESDDKSKIRKINNLF